MRKLVFPVAVTLALLASGWHFMRTRVALASGPVTYTFDTYATYQFHTLKHPTGLVASQGYLFISDTDNNVIRQFLNGSLSVLAGNGQAGYVNGSTTSAEFNQPTGLTGSELGYTHCISGCNCQIVYCWVTVAYALLYVNDTQNFVIREICTGPTGGACVGGVSTVAGNHAQGYVNGSSLSAEFAPMLGLSGTASSPSTGSPFYVADSANNVIRSWDGTNVGTFAGSGTHGLVNAYRPSAQFGAPTKMAWDGNHNMYVTDADNFVIRKIDTAGNVTTFAGSGSPGFTDGQGSAAQFTYPGDIVFNSADGHFYITDSGNNAIRRMDVYGNVTTYAGAKQGGYVNGALLQARFQSPTGLAISPGYLYIADTMNNTIRRIDMSANQVSTYIN